MIYTTGIRPNEYITSSPKATQNRGSVLKVLGTYYPSVRGVNENTTYIRDQLNNYSFFKKMSYQERVDYLKSIAKDNDDNYLSDQCLMVIPYKLSGTAFDKLNLSYPAEPIDIRTIYLDIPRKSGSKAKRHSLVFRPSNWILYEPKVAICEQVTEKYNVTITLNLTPGMLKSLLQKIIRVAPLKIDGIDSTKYLTDVFFLLVRNVGSFVPDLQKFVTGFESGYKRLAVSILEDSYNEESVIFEQLLDIAKSDVSESYTTGMIPIVRKAINSAFSKKYYIYSCRTYVPSEHKLLKNIEQIKSFPSDINMISNIVANNFKYLETANDRPKNMDPAHCLDHHCIPYIYYFDAKDVMKEKYYSGLWEDNSRWNYRKHNSPQPEVRYIQKILWKYINNTMDTFHWTLLNYTTFKVPEINIAGLVGDIPFKVGNLNYFKLLNPRDPDEVIVVRKTNRDKKDFEFKPENIEKDDVIYKLREKCLNEPKEKKYQIYSIGTKNYIEIALKIKENFIHKHADNILLRKLNHNILDRLFFFVNKYTTYIDMTEDPIESAQDPEIFRYFLLWIVLYPAGLEYAGTHKIKIKDHTILNHILSLLLQNRSNEYNPWTKEIIEDDRQLWSHQELALESLLTRDKSLIWIPVGLGKTLIVIRYLFALYKAGLLPEYVIYSLPSSAFDSVIREFKTHSFETNILTKKTSILKNCINFVEHDTLRSIEYNPEIIKQSVFVFDELHKAMNKTIRTSQALRWAKLSRYFIGLTGTILNRSEDLTDLEKWLKPFGDFPVNEKNMYVSVANLISFKKDLHIKVDYNYTCVDTPDDYYNYVPKSLGGKAKSLELYKASELCWSNCYIKMIEDIRKTSEGVFLVVRKLEDAENFKKCLPNKRTFIIRRGNSLTYTKDDVDKYDLVITTINDSTGYTLTKLRKMYTSVYYSNENTRHQLEGRLIRIGQERDVEINIYHCGILTYVMERYKKIRNISKCLSELAKNI